MVPYGLTGVTHTCQCGLYSILRDCQVCVDNYVDGCIVFSDSWESHVEDLKHVPGKLLDSLYGAPNATLARARCPTLV